MYLCNMENKVEYLDGLKSEVLRCYGEEPRTQAEFDRLSSAIEQKTGSRLSAYTLKRLFGYVKSNGSPSINTLSILARYTGYTGWTDYVSRFLPPSIDVAATPKKQRPYIQIGMAATFTILFVAGLFLLLNIRGRSQRNPHEITGMMISGVDTINWTLDKNTWTLTITGKGKMLNFQDGNQPEAWLAYKDSLRRVTIGEGVTSLGDYAFSSCSRLADVNLPISLKAIGNGTFNSCSSLTHLILPEGLESLGYGVFRECRHLQEMVLPRGITELRYNLFAHCYELRSCTLLGPVTTMDRYVFARCTSLRHIDLPATLVMIGSGSFSNCDSLEEISLPEGLTLINEYAFQRCSSLKHVVLPSTLRSVGKEAFNNCDHLELIECRAQHAPRLGDDVFVGISSAVRLVCPQGADYSSWKQAFIQHK